MCAIIGYSGDYKTDLVTKLCQHSRIRGLHSFGFSYMDGPNLQTNKHLFYDAFLDDLHTTKPNKFIAHFRYSTSGDYKAIDNNQPIVRGNISLVFNGVIDMATKAEMEANHGVKLTSENDGELAVIKLQENKQDFPQWLNSKTFAGIFFENNKITAIRNHKRPCYIGEDKHATVIASTSDILTRSNITQFSILNPNQYYVI